jgi:hypothetical protein
VAKLKTMTVKVMQDGAEKEITVAMVGPGGHPLYEIEGKELEQDVDELRAILKSSNDEAASRRVENKELKEKLAVFGDLDPEKAKEALGIVASLDMKKLVDAKDMDTLRAQIEAAWKTNMDAQKVAFEANIAELNTKVAAEQERVRNITLKNAFLGSDFLRQTIYDPVREDAHKLFGDKFDVEAGDNGDMRITFKNPDGTPLLSTARPGQPASFDEAIEHIFTIHPQKDHLMKASQASGSGASGGAGGGSKSTFQQLQEQHAAAMKAGNAALAMSLKDQMFQAQKGGAS